MKTTLGFKVDVEFAEKFKDAADNSGLGKAEFLQSIFIKAAIGEAIPIPVVPPTVALTSGVFAASVSAHTKAKEAYTGNVGIINGREVIIAKRRKMRGQAYNEKLEPYF